MISFRSMPGKPAAVLREPDILGWPEVTGNAAFGPSWERTIEGLSWQNGDACGWFQHDPVGLPAL